MLDTLKYMYANYSSYFRIQDLLDILIVAFVIYKLISFIKETRAGQLIKGIIVLLLILALSDWLGLYTVNYILKNTVQIGVLALVVIFQPEIRRALEKVGTTSINFVSDTTSADDTHHVVDEIAEACGYMADKRIGALIVLERKLKIGEIIKSGISVDSTVTAQLLINIFVPNTPLHDGAVIIRDNRIVAAASVLPLTSAQNLNSELGTRHRAAIGMSENSDAVIIVVSEETGKISIAVDGELTRNHTTETLKTAVTKLMSPTDEKSTLHRIWQIHKEAK